MINAIILETLFGIFPDCMNPIFSLNSPEVSLASSIEAIFFLRIIVIRLFLFISIILFINFIFNQFYWIFLLIIWIGRNLTVILIHLFILILHLLGIFFIFLLLVLFLILWIIMLVLIHYFSLLFFIQLVIALDLRLATYA